MNGRLSLVGETPAALTPGGGRMSVVATVRGRLVITPCVHVLAQHNLTISLIYFSQVPLPGDGDDATGDINIATSPPHRHRSACRDSRGGRWHLAVGSYHRIVGMPSERIGRFITSSADAGVDSLSTLIWHIYENTRKTNKDVRSLH